MKALFLTSLVLIAMLLINSFIQPTMSQLSDYCGKNCESRCAVAGMKDRCLKYCGICCGRCKCVPSGTSGNKHQCPCYRDMRSSKGKPKCP